ncbi:MAG: hypothetical protein RL291_20 [Pseudomonadota bacterium]
MGRLNTSTAYGTVTKAIHWAMAFLFFVQVALAWTMLRTPPDGTALGIGQAALYNWHKSLGLVAFAFAFWRVANRKKGRLPDWAPTLSPFERSLIHRYEQVLYALMFVLPVSGFLYVMAGGFGVHLFGLWHLPRVVPEWAWLAQLAKWTHVIGSYVLVAALATHVGLVLRHQLLKRDGLLRRML